jgi:hypothetical protein
MLRSMLEGSEGVLSEVVWEEGRRSAGLSGKVSVFCCCMNVLNIDMSVKGGGVNCYVVLYSQSNKQPPTSNNDTSKSFKTLTTKINTNNNTNNNKSNNMRTLTV